jgi:reductive dehalogenase
MRRNHAGQASIPGGLLLERRNERYPSRKLKRVDRPTTLITGDVPRADERGHGFQRVMRGDLGPVAQREFFRFIDKYPLGAALAGMEARLVDAVDGPIAPQKAPVTEDPAILSRHIKEVANFLRADAVGICETQPYMFYSHTAAGRPVDASHKYAIAVLIDQNYDSFAGAHGDDWISGSQSFIGYSVSGAISCVLADYIRRLGFPARAHHARDYQVVVPPVLLLAGLGEVCRIGGTVLNPFLGPRFKAAVVTTDLPLQPDKPVDFGLQDFCSHCKKCARECPANAISGGDKTVFNGYECWRGDTDACTRFRVTNARGSSCGRCISVCPWNKPDTWYHAVATGLCSRSKLARRGMIKLDDLLGYGKADPNRKWWFDLEEIDGELTAR